MLHKSPVICFLTLNDVKNTTFKPSSKTATNEGNNALSATSTINYENRISISRL